MVHIHVSGTLCKVIIGPSIIQRLRSITDIVDRLNTVEGTIFD